MKKLLLLLLLLFIPLVSFGQQNVRINYLETENPFKDNDKFLSLSFSDYKSSNYYLEIVAVKSDIVPMSFYLISNNWYNSKFTPPKEDLKTIEFIFDYDKKTKIVLDNFTLQAREIPHMHEALTENGLDKRNPEYIYPNGVKHNTHYTINKKFNEPIIKSMDDKLLSQLKKYNSVYIKMTFKEKEVYFDLSLKGITSSLNKMKEYSSPSKKNMFDYKVTSGLANANPFDLETYVDKFILDAKQNHNIDLSYIDKKNKTNRLIIFRQLEGAIIAAAYESDNDDKVFIQVDPENWQNASQAKRWYIIYHELGHDILNLDHGECGPMMDAVAKANYSWEDLEKDKNTMFEAYKKM